MGRIGILPPGADKDQSPPVLVLSGGAARGAAHLGFLKAMGETGFVPGAIVGTSAGALMGALFSSWDCTTAVPFERLLSMTYSSILRFSFSRQGIFSTGHMEDVIRSSLGKQDFRELSIPFLAAVTNLRTRSLDLLDSGDLASALAASCALPPLFGPVLRGGEPYVDGGVLSILPAKAARDRFPGKKIIAVDVNVSSSSSGRASSSPQGHWIALSILSFRLFLSRTARMERSFADQAVLIPGGNFPLFGLRSIETLHDLGYTAGKEFFGRREWTGDRSSSRERGR